MKVIAFIGILAVFSVPAAAEDRMRSLLFDHGQAILQESREITLYSLNPNLGPLFSFDPKAPLTFHGYPILGSVALTGEAKSELLGKLYTAVTEEASPARCFLPRHGIRAENGRAFIDLVICFECQQAKSYMRSQEGGSTVSRSAETFFNKVLRDANVAPFNTIAFEPPADAKKLCGGHVSGATRPDGSVGPHVIWTAYSSRESPDALVKHYTQPSTEKFHTKNGGCDTWRFPSDAPTEVFEICALSEKGPWAGCSSIPREAGSIVMVSSMAGR